MEVKKRNKYGWRSLLTTSKVVTGYLCHKDLVAALWMTTERPGEPRSYDLQIQVNNGAVGAVGKREKTSKNKASTFKNSILILATVLVDEEVDKEIISKNFMRTRMVKPKGEHRTQF